MQPPDRDVCYCNGVMVSMVRTSIDRVTHPIGALAGLDGRIGGFDTGEDSVPGLCVCSTITYPDASSACKG